MWVKPTVACQQYADTVIWAAGVVASPAARWLDAEHDRAGKVKVGVNLSVPSHPDVFVIGDTAAVTDQPGIPGTAPAAKQMGRYSRRFFKFTYSRRQLS
jgi:NADH dehydrogenase